MMLGIDMNGSRIRALQGPAADFPLPVPLDPPGQDLPMILSLANGSIEVGSAGHRLSRKQPHLTCHGFLPHLGKADGDTIPRQWRGGKHELDADEAMALVWKRLEPMCRKSAGVILGLPSYLNPAQADLIRGHGTKLRLPVLGSLPIPLAGALAGYAEQTWSDSVIVLYIDDHALSIVQVRAVDGQAHVLDAKHLPHLGFRAWRERLLNALADLCVLQSRRDPRASPSAEQGLFEQLDGLLDACHKNRMVQLGIQAAAWYQNLVLQPEKIVGFCAGLIRQVVQEVDAFWSNFRREDEYFSRAGFSQDGTGGRAVLLTTQMVGRLPGLIAALRNLVDSRRDTMKPVLAEGEGEDFGANLMGDIQTDTGSVMVLGPDAPARAIHGLGQHFQRGDLKGHLELVAPLPRPTSVDLGPARLHHQGHDFLLNEHNLFLGSQDGVHLVVDDSRHAGSDARHCEIVLDQRTYILFNRHRDGTLVNDYPVHGSVVLRPGDWVRLGVEGPAARFLGQASNNRTPLTA